MSVDKFDSPSAVVDDVVAAVSISKRSPLVADFTAGDGQLLLGARRAWPRSRLIGTDIDQSAVRRLSGRFPEGSFGRCDFLDGRSRRACGPLRIADGVDVVLLNPPFTCRGARRFDCTFGELEFRTSRALAFMITALQYLSRGGTLVAVLPSGVLTSERDQLAWRWLELNGAEVVSDVGRRAFSGAVVHSVIVRVPGSPRRRPAAAVADPSPDGPTGDAVAVSVFRGKLPRFQVGDSSTSDGILYLHTTDLAGGLTLAALDSAALVNGHDDHALSGPCVLLPRVANPSSVGPVLVEGSFPFVMSDCLFALKSEDPVVTERLYRDCRLHWSKISMEYAGTGARYLTRKRLSGALASLGYAAEHMTRKSWSRGAKVVVSNAV